MISNSDIFSISSAKQFEKVALKVFRYQYENNLVYHQFCNLMKFSVGRVKKLEQIPFLPISFFKTHQVISNTNMPQQTFCSSGTTRPLNPEGGIERSKHFVTDLTLYEQSYLRAFANFYGNIEDFVVLALLPSYLEREGSSLIYMVNDLIKKTNNTDSGFYLNNYNDLILKLLQLEKDEKQVLLIGVTFALLDLIETEKFNLKNTIIMETGGMKGRRKEMIREELHEKLCAGFGVESIHSEYGMTELLSQAYSLGNGVFECPAWMQILIRDPEDALTYLPNGKTGGVNVIDLANINSCSFIATQDLGKINNSHSFEILGRFDNSDIRGCNLMVD